MCHFSCHRFKRERKYLVFNLVNQNKNYQYFTLYITSFDSGHWDINICVLDRRILVMLDTSDEFELKIEMLICTDLLLWDHTNSLTVQ
jgi:hypothetical protein